MSVSAEDREKALIAEASKIMVDAAFEAGYTHPLDPQIKALIAAGLLGGVSACPDREALAALRERVLALHLQVTIQDGPDNAFPACNFCHQEWPCATVRAVEDARAAEHLWTQPAGESVDSRLLAEVGRELEGLLDSLDDHVISDDDERHNVYESIRRVWRISCGEVVL